MAGGATHDLSRLAKLFIVCDDSMMIRGFQVTDDAAGGTVFDDKVKSFIAKLVKAGQAIVTLTNQSPQ